MFPLFRFPIMPPFFSRRLLHPKLLNLGCLGSRHHLQVRCSAGTDLPTQAHRPFFFSVNLQKPPSTTLPFAALPNASGFRSHRRMASSYTFKQFEILEAKLKEEAGIQWDGAPGQFSGMICPKCRGGRKQDRSFSLFISEDGKVAKWKWFRGKCGWTGRIQDGKVRTQAMKGKQSRVITEKELQLEPLSEEFRGYLEVRGITAETLQRNSVMQRRYNDQNFIAFTYRRDGVLVSCKYRSIPKMFWQEPDTERVFYGLDDITHSSEIIIVEGEIDKLSMEEAGYHNCISVPSGASLKVSEVLPEEEKDTSFQYVWNCKEYLDKASRIILATDADGPGQALAEEIARRLGKERCWRVNWPKICGMGVCKDANEVLIYKGKKALKELIETAEFYPIQGLYRFESFFSEIDDYYHCKNGNG